MKIAADFPESERSGLKASAFLAELARKERGYNEDDEASLPQEPGQGHPEESPTNNGFRYKDIDGEVGARKAKARRSLETLTENIVTTINDVVEAMADCATLVNQDKAVFEPRLQSMQQRSMSLNLVNDGGEAFTTWNKKELGKVTEDGKSSHHLPIPVVFFQKICSRQELKGAVELIGKPTDSTEVTLESLSQDESTFNQKVHAIQVLLQAVKSSVSYYRSAKISRDKQIENRQKAQS